MLANMHKCSLETTGALMKGYFHSSCILVARDRSCSPQHKLQHRNIWLPVRSSFLMLICASKAPNMFFWETKREEKHILLVLQSYAVGFFIINMYNNSIIHILTYYYYCSLKGLLPTLMQTYIMKICNAAVSISMVRALWFARSMNLIPSIFHSNT